MKNSLFTSWLMATVIVLASVGGFAQTIETSHPVKYNDYIVDQQNKIGGELIKLIDMFGALPDDKTLCTNQLESILSACKDGIRSLEALKPIPNQFGMKEAAISLFKYYQEIIDTDYRTVIDQLYAETPDMDLLREILARIESSEAAVDAKFQNAQTEFAKYHNIELEDNQLQEKLDESSKE